MTFGSSFNQPLGEGVLPEGLTDLVFKGKYDLNKAVLPSTLRYLEVDGQVMPMTTIKKYQQNNKRSDSSRDRGWFGRLDQSSSTQASNDVIKRVVNKAGD